ncbi:hypothetical protein Dda_2155 [Drechslerella dactyloides]|uniref:BZIP domain-containing protein n=1 Tax=Drechslerella dactyloides TaxID=74499 RepID=A0AAD6NMC7_DREDA|nr:hypothetical protein Dda_2155 [Drechslerella dactyloides]
MPNSEVMRANPSLQTAGLVSKFSARPRPADHKVVQVRENQRRHRARVKAYIAELEARLGETKEQLDAAVAKVEELTAEVEALRAGSSNDSSVMGRNAATQSLATSFPGCGRRPVLETKAPPCHLAEQVVPGISGLIAEESGSLEARATGVLAVRSGVSPIVCR